MERFVDGASKACRLASVVPRVNPAGSDCRPPFVVPGSPGHHCVRAVGDLARAANVWL
jgi:hypothetical protein